MKRLKFYKELSKLILRGEKNTTWRIFDDKNLQVGDILQFIVTENKEEFAKAKIIEVKLKTFEELNEDDWMGHESFNSKEEMYKQYSLYYNQKVTSKTPLKIIKFELL